jgi:hypothetical protein
MYTSLTCSASITASCADAWFGVNAMHSAAAKIIGAKRGLAPAR